MRGRYAVALALALGLVAGHASPAAQAGAPAPAPQATPSLGPEPSPAAPGATPGAATPAEATPTPAPDCLARTLDDAERETLLLLAWHTLSGHLTDQPIKDADLEGYTFSPCLMAPRGLFVTLKKGDKVRGRQGEIEPTRPLYQQVIIYTRRAATRDPRFQPLTERDLGTLLVNLSVIGERRKVGGPAEIHPESDGIFLEKWGRRAVFLPGIGASQGWSVERTLDELCSQATLPTGCWSESARIEAFTTGEISGGLPARPFPKATPSATPEPAPSATPESSPAPGVSPAPGRFRSSHFSAACRTTGGRSTS